MTKTKAKNCNYKFVRIRNGKIYVKKSENCESLKTEREIDILA